MINRIKDSKQDSISPLVFNIIIILSFLILSVINVLLIWNHEILNGNDLYFHFARIIELVKSNKFLPLYALNTYAGNGSAVMTMYPYLLLYPFVLILDIIKNVKIFIYVFFIIETLLSLLISYYSSRFYTNRISRYIFALMYSLSCEFISLNFWSCDIGMSMAAIFMPLIFFGFITWLRNSHFLMLSIGVVLIIYSNLPVAFFTPILLVLWAGYNYKLLNKEHIKNAIKAILLTLLITSLFWIPALKLFLLNKFNGVGSPTGNVLGTNVIKSFIATIIPGLQFSFNGWFPWELTIYSFIGLIVGIICFKRLSYFTKQSFVFSIFILFLCSNAFPWRLHLFMSVGGIIQATIRLYIIPQVILTYVLANYIGYIINKGHKVVNPNYIIMLVIMIIIIIQFGNIIIFHNQQNRNVNHANGIFNQSRLMDIKHVPETDYYPGSKSSINLISHDNGYTYYKNKRKLVSFKPKGNGVFHLFMSTDNNVHKIKIPFINYHGTIYKCYINNRLIKSYPDKTQVMTINPENKLKHGINKIHVKYLINVKEFLIRVVLFIIGLLLLCYYSINLFIKRHIKVKRNHI